MQRRSLRCSVMRWNTQRYHCENGRPHVCGRPFFLRDRIQNMPAAYAAIGSVAAAAAVVARTAHAVHKRLQRSVLAHAVRESGKERPAAALERARREYVSARSENEQDNENPETAIAAKTAIHSFSSYSFPANGRLTGDRRRVCSFCFSAALCYIVCSCGEMCSQNARFDSPKAEFFPNCVHLVAKTGDVCYNCI